MKHAWVWHLGFFTKDVSRTWRMMENLEVGMISMNTGEPSITSLHIDVANLSRT